MATTRRTTTGRTPSKTTNRSTTTTRTRGTRRTGTTTSTSRTTSPATYSPTKFGSVRDDIKWRLGSYRNIYAQVTGPGKIAISPKTAQQWTKYVSNGARVYSFSSTQVQKTFSKQWKQNPTPTPTTVNRWFSQKFGTRNIKGVTRGKGTTWLVAASGSVNRGPFRNYTWK